MSAARALTIAEFPWPCPRKPRSAGLDEVFGSLAGPTQGAAIPLRRDDAGARAANAGLGSVEAMVLRGVREVVPFSIARLKDSR
jgi:hypothetical protein